MIHRQRNLRIHRHRSLRIHIRYGIMTDAQKHNKQVSSMNSVVNSRWFFGTMFESHFSYSAVRRVGDMVYTSGLISVDEDANSVCSKGDVDLQTRYILH